jgi:cell division protein FtsI/penicillin-binding protein 2
MSGFSKPRALTILVLVSLALAGMTGRVAWLQTIGRQQTLRAAERQQFQGERLEARRGTLFDRNLIVMAGTVQKHRLYADPKFLHKAFHNEGRTPEEKKRTPAEARRLLGRLGRLIDKDGDGLLDLIAAKASADERYLILAEELDDRVVDEVNKLRIPGIGLEATSKRYYPMGSIAAHVLGTVGKDDIGRGQKGIEGLELRFNDLLAGRDGCKVAIKNARRQEVGVAEEDYLPPQHGRHLVLTIDANVQMIVEQELAAACERVRAKCGEAVVIDPRTGDLLALANWPTFNPQNVVEEESAAETPQQRQKLRELRRNRAITDPGECGSVIKPFHAGPAFFWKVIRPEEKWPIPGISYVTPYGRRVTDVHGYGSLATWDGLVKSSNIWASMSAERMGNAKLHAAFTSFGFGRRTGVELPGEDPGLVNRLADWTRYSTESVAQGYEIMVTPLQLGRAFCVFANGGHLPPVRIVRGQLDADGNVARSASPGRLEMMPQVVDRATADLMKRILADVPVRGTARGHASKVWNIFGKTGTAHISEGRSGYSATRFNASFICGAPLESPRIVVVVSIHEPDRSIAHYGGSVAAPGAKNIVERTLNYMQVPGSPEIEPPPPHIASVLFSFNPNVYRRPAATPARSPRPSNASAAARP